MLVTFDKEYLKELYVSGKCSDKKHRFQPDAIKRYKQLKGKHERDEGYLADLLK